MSRPGHSKDVQCGLKLQGMSHLPGQTTGLTTGQQQPILWCGGQDQVDVDSIALNVSRNRGHALSRKSVGMSFAHPVGRAVVEFN